MASIFEGKKSRSSISWRCEYFIIFLQNKRPNYVSIFNSHLWIKMIEIRNGKTDSNNKHFSFGIARKVIFYANFKKSTTGIVCSNRESRGKMRKDLMSSLISLYDFFHRWMDGACEWGALRRYLGLAMNWTWIDGLAVQLMSSFVIIPFFIYSRHNFVCVNNLSHSFLLKMQTLVHTELHAPVSFSRVLFKFPSIWQCVSLQEIAMMRSICCISTMIKVLIQCEAHNEIKRVHTRSSSLANWWNTDIKWRENERLFVHETSACLYMHYSFSNDRMKANSKCAYSTIHNSLKSEKFPKISIGVCALVFLFFFSRLQVARVFSEFAVILSHLNCIVHRSSFTPGAQHTFNGWHDDHK